jgi:PhzF family phenazine biosynthesis protein
MKDIKEIRQLQIFQVNAFVKAPYQGNPAGVCLLLEERDEDYYRKVVIKMDFAETAFIFQKDNTLNLRWFTRAGNEVDLCGHATLASAYILWGKGYIRPAETIRFQTKSGILTAKSDGEHITLGFPLEEITVVDNSEYDFENHLGLTPLFIGRTRFDYLLVADTENAVKYLTPDFEKLKNIQTRGVIVTAKSENEQYDFVSRFFAPSIGVNEDPVTGSAHNVLGIYWSGILKKKKLIGYQASREGGIVGVEVLKDRVLLSGRAQEIPMAIKLRDKILSLK